MAISVFDLFKIGIGPSSSHTVGPMRAAALFVESLRGQHHLEQVRRIEVQLFGSLSATGIGHGSDNAVIMGLMGEWPDAIDPAQIGPRIQALRETDTLLLDGRLSVPFVWARDMRLIDENLPFHPNAMTIVADGDHGELHRDTYYSVGGGFVVDEAQASSGVVDLDRTELPYDFSSAVELLDLCKKNNLRVAELMMANEKVWRSEEEIRAGLMKLWRAMQDCVEQGLKHEGILPGGLNVRRRAAKLHRSLQELGKPNVIGSTLSAMEWVNLFALAVNEENAAGGRMVTAPTNGAAGIIPAVLHYFMKFSEAVTDANVVDYFLECGGGGDSVQEECFDLGRRSGLSGRSRFGVRNGGGGAGGDSRCYAGAVVQRGGDWPGT
jgi:L-serine dehydratase